MSKIQSIITPAAQIVSVVSLKTGDVYKRLVENYGEPKMQFGVVAEVLNNGERVVLNAVEYAPDLYGNGVRVETKTFTDKSDVQMFPAVPDEIEGWLAQVRATAVKQIDKAEADMVKASETLRRIDKIADQVALTGMTAAQTVVVPAQVQDEDDSEVASIEQ